MTDTRDCFPVLRDEFQEVQSQWDAAKIGRATCDEEMAYLAGGLNELHKTQVPGVVLECGCFTGFSSTCLSIASERFGRQLVVADSFEGLPNVGPHPEYHPGQYASTRVEWETNVGRLGRRWSIDLRVGWFADTLKDWSDIVALIWLDVDLGQSVHDVLTCGAS
jgi:O-methyltransferase